MVLVPKIRVNKYPNEGVDKNGDPDTRFGPVLALEFTRRNEGPGIGFGIGQIDIWIGWPKKQEPLCSWNCEFHGA